MARKQTADRTFSGEFEVVFRAAYDAAVAHGLTIKSADPATGAIAASSAVSMRSWGENVDIQVTATDPGSIQVAIISKVKLQLVDWGKNQQNIDGIFRSIDAILRGGPATLGR